MNKNLEKNKSYYITTPIYYPSGEWHIGHCYTSINCDAIARYYKMQGLNVLYSTGTDEHGAKIEKVAMDKGISPKQLVDERADNIKQLFSKCLVDYDRFIRTTDKNHEQTVQGIFKKLYDKGDIYKGTYKGKYCTPCESFWTESQLQNGNCPDCARTVVDACEETYFFRLSKYSDRVLDLLTKTDFLEPQSRVNEMVTFIKEGLNDLAVTRSSVEWGVKVPWDTKHSIYVWIDALSNYITLLGFNPELELKNQPLDFKTFWPANVHMVGKEIVRFHAVIWPAILMALDVPTPHKVYGHGWLLFNGDKMSKSKGNVIDPIVLIDKYGVDALRYYLLSGVPFGNDGSYTTEMFLTKINTDLVNDYGNLVRRTFSMAKQYFNNIVENNKTIDIEQDSVLVELIQHTTTLVDTKIKQLDISGALNCIFSLIGQANKYIDTTKPWVLCKNNNKDRLACVVFNLLKSIQVSTALLLPFLPIGPKKVLDAMGIQSTVFKDILSSCKTKFVLQELDMLYPRIDIDKELKQNAMDFAAIATNNNVNGGKDMQHEKNENLIISIDDFFKTTLKVGVIKKAQPVKRSNKLLELQVEIGTETRTILSGIANSYTCDELINKSVVVVTNLAPAKLCGIESNGMLLAAVTEDDKSVLLSPEKIVPSGTAID